MELDQIQATWAKLSEELEQQKKLTNEIILQMTQERYSNKFRTISNIETIGAIFCFALAVYILANFGVLDTWYQQLSAIFTIVFLFVQPILVLRALSKIKRMNILNKNLKETVVGYTKAKTNLLRIQQYGILASFPFMITSLAVMPKIMVNKDFFMMEHSTILYVFLGLTTLLAILVALWGYRHYKRITASAEAIIKGIEL